MSERLEENRIFVLRAIGSTNQYIIDNLQYIQSGDVFVTDHQTNGRGRYNKFWITPNTQGIALSMYWKINHRLSILSELSVIISLVTAKILKELGVFQVKIKWPNDLYVYDRKLAGILVEIITRNNKISHVIIGIGINISVCLNTRLMMKISNNWIDLKALGIVLSKKVLVVNLVKELRLTMTQFVRNKYALFSIYYEVEWDYLYNQSVALLFRDHVDYGTVMGIEENGVLLVKNQSGTIYRYSDDNISVVKI